MKDAIKRIVIVLILLICIVFVIQHFINKKEVANISKNEVEMSTDINEPEEKKEEVIEKETDEIEQYQNSKARVNTTLNFRKEPNIESEIIEKLSPETIVDVKSKIRNRMV